MLEKGQNVNKNYVKRLLQVDEKLQRIDFLDHRFYKRNGEYYPSVTSILQAMPKGKFFESWLKDVGHNADIIVAKAADEGTQTHDLIERYLKGEKLEFIDENGHIKCPFKVWEMVLKFDDFWTKHKPTLIESEIHLFSDKYKFAGTSDLIVEMNNERWIIDMKTSNSLHTSYDLQLAAYAKAWDELYEEKIDKVGILWLKSSKRGEDKKGEKIQGKGWELYESPRNIKENFELFEKVYDIFKLENPNPEPMLNSFPMTLQLKN
jgi:ATP-dependent exoDNAse (exonuclease V) beta subunit